MRSYLLAAMLVAFACNVPARAQSQESAPKEGLWSKIKRITAEEVGNVVSVNGQPIGAGVGMTAPDGTERKRIHDTPLHDIFNSDAAINADYPHVAITITDYSDRIVSRGMNPMSAVQRNDCLFFKATLWRSNEKSEQFDHLAYCADEGIKGFLKGAFSGGFRYGSTVNANTGQRRTTGPLSPAIIYPRGSEDDRILDGPGYALLGNLLMKMGFDFTYGGNIGRVWVVSTKNVPGT